MTKPISGKTEECLEHFSNNHKEMLDADRCRLRKKISKTLMVTDTSGYNWFSRKIMPSGVNLIKLRFLLELMGYSVRERISMSETQRELANQLAFGLLSLERVAEELGVSENTVLRWGSGRANPEDEDSLQKVLNLHKEEAQKKLASWREQLQEVRNISIGSVDSILSQVEIVSKPTSNGSHRKHTTIETLAHLILAAKPLAEEMLTDDFTSEDRDLLRQKTLIARSSGVFDLSNSLNRLCGERARKELPSHQPQQR